VLDNAAHEIAPFTCPLTEDFGQAAAFTGAASDSPQVSGVNYSFPWVF
jgi:hypothetical protein